MNYLNIIKQKQTLSKTDKENLLNQRGFVIWLTGLSGSGKSTIANELEKWLNSKGKLTTILDGDNIRLGLCKDLSFSDDDRRENIRRIAEVSKLLSDTGVITITAFISPFIEEREMAKEIVGKENFIEVYVSTSLDVCEKRDVKGLYKKARSGEIKKFTGIDSPYESPTNPDLVIDGSLDLNESIMSIINHLQENEFIHTIKEVNNLDKKKTISIDFDGVIHKYSRGFMGLDNVYDEPMLGVLEGLKELKESGYILKILSSRPKEYIKPWLIENNLYEYIDDISNHKFPASVYIDDRGFKFENCQETVSYIKNNI